MAGFADGIFVGTPLIGPLVGAEVEGAKVVGLEVGVNDGDF